MLDYVDHSLHIVGEETAQIMRYGRHGVVDISIVHPAQVSGNDDIAPTPKGVIRGKRFVGKDVQRSTGDLFLIQCLDQRALVDDATTRQIDDAGAWLHRR
jgi:hypothetical protein